MKRLRLVVILLSFFGVSYHVYVWGWQIRGTQRIQYMAALMAYESGWTARAPGLPGHAKALIHSRLLSLWQHRLLGVVALGLSILQGLVSRKSTVAPAYWINLRHSASVALVVSIGMVAVAVTLPNPVPYKPLVAVLCLLLLWIGWSATVSFPVSV